MNAIFVHDHKFIRRGIHTVYSSGAFPFALWERYLKVFDTLEVIARSLDSNELSFDRSKLAISSGVGVEFFSVPNLNNLPEVFLKFNEVRGILTERISKADAVITRVSVLGLLAIEVARVLNKPTLVEVVGCPWDAFWNYGTWQGNVAAPLAYLWARHAIKNADFVSYVSQDFLQRRYPTNGRSIGVSDVMLRDVRQDVLDKRLERLSSRSPLYTLGIIGSLEHLYKGIDIALFALQKIKLMRPDICFELCILGPGDSSQLEKLARDLNIEQSVRFDATLPSGNPVMEWLDGIDIYLQPSFQEGIGRSLIEAMSRGCFVLGSDVGGTPEIIDARCLHRAGDHEMLAHQIINAIETPDWFQYQVMANFERSKSFSESVLEPKREAFLREFAEYCRNINPREIQL